MISQGEKAPTFSLRDRRGEAYELEQILGKYTVLFFYPKDDTPGCTTEAVGFQEHEKEFSALGAVLVGISGGDEKSKQKFCEKHNLSIPMLSDTDFSVSRSYGVYGEKNFMGKSFLGIKRVTFVLDEQGTVIKVFDSVTPKDHPQEVLTLLASL